MATLVGILLLVLAVVAVVRWRGRSRPMRGALATTGAGAWSLPADESTMPLDATTTGEMTAEEPPPTGPASPWDPPPPPPVERGDRP